MVSTPTLPFPQVQLNNGISMDQLGFGVYKIPPEDTAHLCSVALSAGYRQLDTASLYGNEAGVGQAVRQFTESTEPGHERSDIFVTTKVWNDRQGYSSTLDACSESLKTLGLDYVDLYLIHWPAPARDLYLQTYRALETLYRDGLVRSIGVSNFKQPHLQRLLDSASVVPAVNQVELHPWLQQEDLRQFNSDAGIHTEAWSPLGRGAVLEDAGIRALATELGRTPAQVVLRWHLQLGNIVIPKASNASRIAENADVVDFELSEAQMGRIASMDRGQRAGSDPDDVN